MSSDDNKINNLTLNETIIDPPTTTTNQQGTDQQGDTVTQTTFVTEERNDLDVNITQNLTSEVTIFNNNNDNEIKNIVNEIQFYAREIKCEDFHGKGSIDDYKELFIAASNITNEVKNLKLDINVEGLVEFGDAADELSSIFTSYITKLETISIIDDKDFLRNVVNSLKKIYNLSNTFARFKQTIMATSAIHIPKSTIDVCNEVKNVMPEIDCAMGYISNFVNPDTNFNSNSQLSSDEKKTINNAISAINNWKILSEQGASIAMENNEDIKNLKQFSASLKVKSNSLKNLTMSIKTKLSSYQINNKPLLERQYSN